MQLVVDWLEGVARVGLEQYPMKAAYFTDNVCWEHTLHDLSHGIDSDVLVTEMVRSRYLVEIQTKCVCVVHAGS